MTIGIALCIAALKTRVATPRLFTFDELADENEDGSITCKDIDPSVEALPRALQFLNAA